MRIKFEALTVLELSTFNTPTVWPVCCTQTDRRTIRWKYYLSQFTSFTCRR